MNSDCQSLGHFFRVWTQIFIRVSNLRFTSCINSGFFSAIVSIPGFSQQLLIVNFLVFYKAQLRFKTQVFNLQMLTQTEFENSQNSYFRPKKGHISSLPQLTWPKLNVIHTLEPGWQMMDSFGLWSTQINEIFRISFFLTGGLNGGVRFLFILFFGHQGIHIWP